MQQKAAVSFSLLLVLVSLSLGCVCGEERVTVPSSFALPLFSVSLVLLFRREKRMEDKSPAKQKRVKSSSVQCTI